MLPARFGRGWLRLWLRQHLSGGRGLLLFLGDGGGGGGGGGGGRWLSGRSWVGPGIIDGLGIGEEQLPVVCRAEELTLLGPFPLGEGVPTDPQLHLAVGALEAAAVEEQTVGRHLLHQVQPLAAEVTVVAGLCCPHHLGRGSLPRRGRVWLWGRILCRRGHLRGGLWRRGFLLGSFGLAFVGLLL